MSYGFFNYFLVYVIIGLPFVVLGQVHPHVESSSVDRDSCHLSVSGRVYDRQSGAPLEFVNVLIENLGRGSVTDGEGYFRIDDLCEKEYDLLFTYIGYKALQHHHDYHHPFMEIYLAPDAYELQSVVVEEHGTHRSSRSLPSTRIGDQRIEELSTASFGELASDVTGVHMLKTGQNIVKPIIHGLHSNRVLVMNRGVRHEFQNWGSDHAPEIDPSLVDQLEVIKGAATVRFGPDALGGVIRIPPKEIEMNSEWNGELKSTIQTNGRSGELSTGFQKGWSTIGIYGGGAYTKQGDLHAPDYILSNTGKEEYSVEAGFRLHPMAELDVVAYVNHFDQRLGILQGSVFGSLEDFQMAIESDEPSNTDPFTYHIDRPRQEVNHTIYSLEANYVGDAQSFHIHYGLQRNDRQEYALRRVDAPNIDLELITHSVDARWHHPQWMSVSGQLGVQWSSQENDNQPGTQTVPFIPNYDETRIGAYIIESWQRDQATWELGLRYDYVERYVVGREPDNAIYRNRIIYRNASGTIGWNKEIGDHHQFRSNLGTAWRAPNMAELYRFGQHNFYIEYGLWRYTIDEEFDFVTTEQGILDDDDRHVPPEIGVKWINSWQYEGDALRCDVTVYANYISNYIYSRPAGVTRTPRGVFPFYIYDQTQAIFAGLDMETQIDHANGMESQLGGSILWSKQVGQRDYFSQQPSPQLRYRWRWTPRDEHWSHWSFRLGLQYTFEQFLTPRILSLDDYLTANQTEIRRFGQEASDFDILPPPPGFLLLDAGVQVFFGPVTLRLGVDNLLNQSYRLNTDRLRYIADDLGRNFSLSVKYYW